MPELGVTDSRNGNDAVTSIALNCRKVPSNVRLVDRCELDALDLVLEHQLAALQFDNLEIVGGKMLESVVQFVFQNFVFAFQFNEMRLNCHKKSPLLVDLRSDKARFQAKWRPVRVKKTRSLFQEKVQLQNRVSTFAELVPDGQVYMTEAVCRQQSRNNRAKY